MADMRGEPITSWEVGVSPTKVILSVSHAKGHGELEFHALLLPALLELFRTCAECRFDQDLNTIRFRMAVGQPICSGESSSPGS